MDLTPWKELPGEMWSLIIERLFGDDHQEGVWSLLASSKEMRRRVVRMVWYNRLTSGGIAEGVARCGSVVLKKWYEWMMRESDRDEGDAGSMVTEVVVASLRLGFVETLGDFKCNYMTNNVIIELPLLDSYVSIENERMMRIIAMTPLSLNAERIELLSLPGYLPLVEIAAKYDSMALLNYSAVRDPSRFIRVVSGSL